jgi:hypothetical protein
MSKEMRAALLVRQREAAAKYRDDIEIAWAKIDEATEELATTHHKSLRRIQSDLHMGRHVARRKRIKTSLWNAFCWKKRQEMQIDGKVSISPLTPPFRQPLYILGSNAVGKSVLQDLVHSHRSEYNALTPEQSTALIREFEECKNTKATGVRISARSKVNDIKHTIAAIETEVCLCISLDPFLIHCSY